jgi:hypothetical protein
MRLAYISTRFVVRIYRLVRRLPIKKGWARRRQQISGLGQWYCLYRQTAENCLARRLQPEPAGPFAGGRCRWMLQPTPGDGASRLDAGSAESIVVASGREMFVRLGLCRVGVRQVVGGRILRARRTGRAIGLASRAGGRARSVGRGAGRPGGWIGSHDGLLH